MNHQICSDSFPLPNIETECHEFADVKYFAKVDLKSPYNQIKIDSKFQEVIILNTPVGLIRWTCLLFGVKTSSHIIQKAIEKVLEGIKNTIVYQDGIVIGMCSKEFLKCKMEQVLRKLNSVGMTIAINVSL